MCFVEDGVAGGFELGSGGVFKPYGAIGGGETQKSASGGEGGVQLGSSDAGLLNGDMAAEYAEMGQVWAAAGETLEGGDVARECGVRKSIFDVDGVSQCMGPVGGV